MFNFDPPDMFKGTDKSEMNTLESNIMNTSVQSNTLSTSKPLSSFFNKLANKQVRSKSPFKFMNRLSREASPMSTSTTATSIANAPNAQQQQQSKQGRNGKLLGPGGGKASASAAASSAKVARTAEFGIKNSTQPKPVSNPPTQSLSPASAAAVTQRKSLAAQNYDEFGEDAAATGGNYSLMESDDVELQAIIDYVDEFYYGVRLFPGQDSSKVFVGWTTSRFHLLTEKLDRPFSRDLISKCTLINTSSDGSIVSSLTRQECFVLSAAELNQNFADASDLSSSKRITDSLLLGCIVDLATGVLTFTVNGKESSHKFQVEPGTKLYPAVFVEPTTKEILQFELGRVRNCLPLSAALFPSLGKHVAPKCPPRLKLQFLNSIGWSRVPNVNLKVHTLKMNNILGWSLLCEEQGITIFYTFFSCFFPIP